MVKHHPASVDLETLKRLITITKTGSLKQFLSKDLSNISREFAGEQVSMLAHLDWLRASKMQGRCCLVWQLTCHVAYVSDKCNKSGSR